MNVDNVQTEDEAAETIKKPRDNIGAFNSMSMSMSFTNSIFRRTCFCDNIDDMPVNLVA
jgi:hypothetical protein